MIKALAKREIPSSLINPWLEQRIKVLHAILTDDELQSLYKKMYGDSNDMGWDDFIYLIAIRYSITAYPFLTLHRNDMDLEQEVREWFYWNNVDTALDLVQITDEELRFITAGKARYYDIITEYLASHDMALLHTARRTFKVSGCSIMAERPAKLTKWKIRNPETTHIFNPSRPTVLPEWFDEFYRRYERIKDEDKYCQKLVPFSATTLSPGSSTFRELFSSLREMWKAYNESCEKCHITPRLPQYRIPEDRKELLCNFPLGRFIALKKDALRALIDFFDQAGVLFSCPLGTYIETKDHYKELDITELEKDEELQHLMVRHVSMQIDFDNLIWEMSIYRKFKNNPIDDWPYNPWLQEKILEYRNSCSDDRLRSHYHKYLESHSIVSWIDFMAESAIEQAACKDPALIIPLGKTGLDKDIQDELLQTDVRVLGDLVQITRQELDILFDADAQKIRQIDLCLKKHGLKIYSSDLLTRKVPFMSIKISNFAVN